MKKALVRGIQETGLETGLVTGVAKIGGFDVVLAVNNFGLVGSSLCDEIGEKFRYAAGQALDTRTPMVSVAMGGGARMQEGTPSMHRNIPKIQHALNALQEAGVPHISVICDPTLGGTAISYGLRGDYMIVVEGSTNIGFTGKRVVEQFQESTKSRPTSRTERGCCVAGLWMNACNTDRLSGRLAETAQARGRRRVPGRPPNTCRARVDAERDRCPGQHRVRACGRRVSRLGVKRFAGKTPSTRRPVLFGWAKAICMPWAPGRGASSISRTPADFRAASVAGRSATR